MCTMKLFHVAAAILVLPVTLAQSSQVAAVSYDGAYDIPNGSLRSVACSDGINGLYNKFHNFSSLPSFPNIGGVPVVTGFDSPACGSCWQLTYEKKSINITAVDVSGNGFNIALAAMNSLTGGLGEHLGRVNATAKRVDPAGCGLPEASIDDDEDC